MPTISRTMILTGSLAGQSVNLRSKYNFVNGELTLKGDEHDVNCEVRTLERNFSAVIKGHVDPETSVGRTRLDEMPEAVLGAGVEVLRRSLPDSTSPTEARSCLITILIAMDQALEMTLKGEDYVQRGVQKEGQKPNGHADVLRSGEPDGGGTPPEGADVGSGAAPAIAGTSGELPQGNGQPQVLNVTPAPPHDPTSKHDPKPVLNEKLARAVRALDAEDEANWTADLKPSMSAVAKAYGSSGLTRADVEAAAPGFRRYSDRS